MSTTTQQPKTLISFHGDAAIKEKYLLRLQAHRIADEIIQGVGYEVDGAEVKGCAIGCTLNKYDHKAFETELGIPMVLAKLEDRIFEGLSVDESKDFPSNFLSAIPIGKDLGNVYKHFLIWLLSDPEDGVIRFAKTEQTKSAILTVSAKLKFSLENEVTKEEWAEVRKIAYAAAAADAAAYAADAAAAAAAYAYAAAADAAYAAAAVAADAAARKKHYSKMASKIIELLKEA